MCLIMQESHSMYPSTRLFRFVSYVIAITLFVGLATACEKEEASKPEPEKQPVTVTLYLAAPQIEYAGIYAAISQGYFEDEKLNVELVFSVTADQAVSNSDPIDALERGDIAFVDGTAETLLRRRQRGLDFVAVLTQYQRDSRSIISIPSKQIESPQDLAGKRLLILPGNATITSVFFQAAGVNPDEITLVDAEGQGIDWVVTQLITGAVDALVFSIEVAAQMDAAGLGSKWIAFYDYGVQSYANVLCTSRQMITQHPDVVQRFVNAVLRGLQHVIDRPEEVAAWFVENYGDQLHPLQLDVQDEAILAIIPLIQTATSKPGMMSPDAWEYLNQTMVEAGLLEPGLTTADTYTLKFLDAYYKQ